MIMEEAELSMPPDGERLIELANFRKFVELF
jgi:hypothetical protein